MALGRPIRRLTSADGVTGSLPPEVHLLTMGTFPDGAETDKAIAIRLQRQPDTGSSNIMVNLTAVFPWAARIEPAELDFLDHRSHQRPSRSRKLGSGGEVALAPGGLAGFLLFL